MRLDKRSPGTSTTFVDSESGEHILQIASDEHGVLLVAYRLYDDSGSLVADSPDLHEPALGLAVHSASGDLLLHIPVEADANLEYRLYGTSGRLLTFSDGVRTRIYPHLRMEGVGRSWVRQGNGSRSKS